VSAFFIIPFSSSLKAFDSIEIELPIEHQNFYLKQKHIFREKKINLKFYSPTAAVSNLVAIRHMWRQAL
jgi:hypothetical protein